MKATHETCSELGCGRPTFRRGLCGRHYDRLRRAGLPKPPTDVERFWAKVDRSSGPGVCWPWTAGVNRRRGGYGLIRFGGKNQWAHRVAWRLANGREPEPGMNICHRCANPVCCNPAHLYEGTPERNNQDIVDHGHAWWQNSTHCSNGHEWTPENTIYGYFPDRPHVRRCRQCEDAMKVRRATKAREKYRRLHAI